MKAEPLVAYAGVGVALAGTVVCYCIATLALHPPLEFFLPTISELGDRPPASSIFS